VDSWGGEEQQLDRFVRCGVVRLGLGPVLSARDRGGKASRFNVAGAGEGREGVQVQRTWRGRTGAVTPDASPSTPPVAVDL
jgi:hypothetical protein